MYLKRIHVFVYFLVLNKSLKMIKINPNMSEFWWIVYKNMFLSLLHLLLVLCEVHYSSPSCREFSVMLWWTATEIDVWTCREFSVMLWWTATEIDVWSCSEFSVMLCWTATEIDVWSCREFSVMLWWTATEIDVWSCKEFSVMLWWTATEMCGIALYQNITVFFYLTNLLIKIIISSSEVDFKLTKLGYMCLRFLFW